MDDYQFVNYKMLISQMGHIQANEENNDNLTCLTMM